MSQIQIKKVSIVDTGCQCVVNAANARLQRGSGVCGAIFSSCGNPNALQMECDRYHGCPTGSAVITSGYSLAQYIIHAVGPIYSKGSEAQEEQLYNAYFKSLLLSKSYHIHSIAFPLISSGIYHYPILEAWRIALKAIHDFICIHHDFDIDIVFAVLDEQILKEGLKEAKRYGW